MLQESIERLVALGHVKEISAVVASGTSAPSASFCAWMIAEAGYSVNEKVLCASETSVTLKASLTARRVVESMQ